MIGGVHVRRKPVDHCQTRSINALSSTTIYYIECIIQHAQKHMVVWLIFQFSDNMIICFTPSISCFSTYVAYVKWHCYFAVVVATLETGEPYAKTRVTLRRGENFGVWIFLYTAFICWYACTIMLFFVQFVITCLQKL